MYDKSRVGKLTHVLCVKIYRKAVFWKELFVSETVTSVCGTDLYNM
jgi:hypothetical protein